MVGILLGSVVVSFGLILIPILGMTIGEEKKLYRVVNTVVIVGLIAWLALMVITYFSPVMQHL
jgi:sterol desaturase/sphingolipid hydroxylase (fatty acid hydroxylase superfamily)